MNKVRHFFQKIWVPNKPYIKVLLVSAAFLVMAVSSCIIMNRKKKKKLLEHADETINDVQSFISATLARPEITINFIADTIQRMILRGESFDSIKDYMIECSSAPFKERISTFDYIGIFGYFDVFESFFDGGGFDPYSNYYAKERPWYTAAIGSGNKAVISPIYVDVKLGIFVIGFSRCLYDKDNTLLGVVSINVPLDFINNIITEKRITNNTYAFMINEDLMVITHPSRELIGEIMGTSHADIAQVTELIKQDIEVSLYRVKGHRDINSFIFSRKINNGWYINFVVPEAEYYKELYEMMVIIGILGLLMASALSVVLIKIDIARSRLETQNRQKSNFLAVMSHEIRTPMNAIMGIAESQLQEHDETLTLGIREAFNRIHYSGSLLLQIISDLLDLSKIEAGKLDINPERYEVADLIDGVVHFNKLKFDSKPIEFIIDVDENIPASLIGDDLRIKQIINNLLSNAFKYTRKGDVTLSMSILAADSNNDDKSNVVLVVSVSDTGQGISPQDMKSLFTEYTRFNVRENRSTVGTGLGLSITRNLVHLMNGEIFVESQLKKGSKFTVHLPQMVDVPEGMGPVAVLGKEAVDNLQRSRFINASQVKKPAILREDMSYGSVLIVDDVEMNLFVAKLLLRPYGLKVDTASSGYDAIDKIKEGNAYDMIFMDHMMPKMDGIEATKIIRNTGYRGSIVALTANAVAGQANMFLSNGFNDFISKPIDIRVLDSVLNKHMRNKNNGNLNTEQLVNEKLSGGEKEVRNMGDDVLFSLPGLNAEQGLDVFDGETEDYISALNSFVKNAPEVIEKLRNVTKENLPEYAINIHGLKSISGWICAENINTNAAVLEALAKANDFSGVMAQNEKFLKDTETFIKDLSALLEKYSGE